MSNYEQDAQGAQLTRATFNKSGGRLLARCHTGMAETSLTGSMQNLRDLIFFFFNSQFILSAEYSGQPLHSFLCQI